MFSLVCISPCEIFKKYTCKGAEVQLAWDVSPGTNYPMKYIGEISRSLNKKLYEHKGDFFYKNIFSMH